MHETGNLIFLGCVLVELYALNKTTGTVSHAYDRNSHFF